MNIILRVIHDLLYVHPLHTLIVHFPIALTTVALFFILLALWRKSDLLEKIAFADMTLVTLSTIVAAIAGMRDNLMYFNGAAPNHFVKIILATLLFIVSTAITLVRWRNPNLFHAGSAKGMYVLGYFVCFALAGVLGFLGGVIVYGF